MKIPHDDTKFILFSMGFSVIGGFVFGCAAWAAVKLLNG